MPNARFDSPSKASGLEELDTICTQLASFEIAVDLNLNF